MTDEERRHGDRRRKPNPEEDRALDEFLDRAYGPDRGSQIPGHYGNGTYRAPTDDEKRK